MLRLSVPSLTRPGPSGPANFAVSGTPPGPMGPKAGVPCPRIENKTQYVALEPGPVPQLGHFLFLNSLWGCIFISNSSFAGKVALELVPAPHVALFFNSWVGDLGWPFRLAP